MLFGWLLARVKGAAFVIDVRDLLMDAATEVGYVEKSLWVKMALQFERFFFLRADKVITVSSGWRERLERKGVDAEDIALVPIGFEPAISEAVDWGRDVREEYDLEGKFTVLYAGMMGHIPDILTLLKAAERLKDHPNIQFVLIGTGQRVEEYREFCSEKELTNCHFLGVMPRKMIPVFCRSVDVCINLFPKGDLGASILGSKTFDYMASATPMIYAGDGEGTAKLLRESKGGIVVPAEDADGVAEAILSLYEDPEMGRQMGERASEYVLEHYSAEQLMSKIERILLQVAR
jgi:colanic acid biosynthesis glycosyl transferase WcaI